MLKLVAQLMMTKSTASHGKELQVNGGMVLNKSKPRRKLGKSSRDIAHRTIKLLKSTNERSLSQLGMLKKHSELYKNLVIGIKNMP
jgi:hypothetical protein